MRRILILLLCLLGTGFAQAADAQPKGYSKVESKLDTQWEKICNGDVCSYSIGVTAVEKENVWVRLYLHNYFGEQVLVVDTPKHSYLARGVGLKAPERGLVWLPYVRCRPSSCYTQIELTTADVTQFDQDAETNFVLPRDWMNGIGISISLKGLRAMLADIASK